MAKKSCQFWLLIALVAGLLLLSPHYALAREIPSDPAPLNSTPLEMKEKKLELFLSEESLRVEVTYILSNPTDKLVRTKLSFPFPHPGNDSLPAQLQVRMAGKELATTYSAKQQAYSWEIQLAPLEEASLGIRYFLWDYPDTTGNFTISYSDQHSELPGPSWPVGEETKSSLVFLFFGEIHPGQITDLQPSSYQITANSLVWTWTGPLPEKILIAGNLTEEKDRWTANLDYREKRLQDYLLAAGEYHKLALFYREKYSESPREEREDYLVAEAYYLGKARKADQSRSLWEDLYQEKALSPRVYWELGKIYADRPGKLEDLYQRVKELQIHPLTQAWLAAQLPSSLVRYSPPEFVLTTAYFEEGQPGVVVKGHFSDMDGDISSLTLKYHWEDEPEQEIPLDLEPFCYEYTPVRLIPAEKPLQRLFYKFVIRDKTGNQTTTGTREAFYLNSEISGESTMLDGANLVLGDYPPAEEDKVRKWVADYLRQAGNAKFIPLKAQNPYLIFLGEYHPFIDTSHGSHFIMHTPLPFSPQAAKLQVHRYFLSRWYGPGWNELAEKDLNFLGDALLFGKGYYAKVMEYLLNKDKGKFETLLSGIGQGFTWPQALAETYGIAVWRAQLNTLWFIYRNRILAILIIIGFAWLGKTGCLIKIARFLIPQNRS